MRKLFVLFAVILALQLASGASAILSGLENAISSLCLQLKSLLPVTAMLMLILGGVIYAAGQMMGAETRARANVWATACLTGALIAILIVVVAQPVLQLIYGSEGTIACEVA